MNRYSAIGIVEVSFYANAVVLLDEMLKAANVTFLKAEKLLGGRLVSLIVGGSTSSVEASVAAAVDAAASRLKPDSLKVAHVISNPHHEIMRFIEHKRKETDHDAITTP